MSAFRVRHVESVVLWLWITPLGLPVVPEVKAIRMTSFARWPAPGGAAAPAFSTMLSSDTSPGAAPPVAGLPRTQTALRSEEHTSELQSRTLISYAVFCLKKK